MCTRAKLKRGFKKGKLRTDSRFSKTVFSLQLSPVKNEFLLGWLLLWWQVMRCIYMKLAVQKKRQRMVYSRQPSLFFFFGQSYVYKLNS
jgi:hypothetical protein